MISTVITIALPWRLHQDLTLEQTEPPRPASDNAASARGAGVPPYDKVVVTSKFAWLTACHPSQSIVDLSANSCVCMLPGLNNLYLCIKFDNGDITSYICITSAVTYCYASKSYCNKDSATFGTFYELKETRLC